MKHIISEVIFNAERESGLRLLLSRLAKQIFAIEIVNVSMRFWKQFANIVLLQRYL